MRRLIAGITDSITAAARSGREVGGRIVTGLTTLRLHTLPLARTVSARLSGRVADGLPGVDMRPVRPAMAVAGAAGGLAHDCTSRLWSRPSRPAAEPGSKGKSNSS